MIPLSRHNARGALPPSGALAGCGGAGCGSRGRGRPGGSIAVAAAVLALLAMAAGCTRTGDIDGPDSAGLGGEDRATAAIVPEGLETPAADPQEAPAAANPNGRTSTDPGDCSLLDAMIEIEDSVFQVILSGSGGVELGTAFYIGDGEFLTAAHIVADHTSVRVRNAIGDFPATVAATDPLRDVALLRGAEPPSRALRFRNSADIRPAQVVASVGYPLFEAYRASITGGLISRITEDRNLGVLIQTDAPINRGNSGGPLIDECGGVVGMIVEKWFEEGVDGVAWAIAGSSLETALADLRTDLSPATATTVLDPAGTTSETVCAGPLSIRQETALGEVGALFEAYHNRIEVAARHVDSPYTDAATQERILWQLAEDTDRYRHSLMCERYDLDRAGPNCDIARRTYARALGWTSRWAGYAAAQIGNRGQYESEVAKALRMSRDLGDEADDYRDKCLGDR